MDREIDSNKTWNTNQELAFIAGLGSHGEQKKSKEEVITLLEKYVAAISARSEWDNIFRAVVLEAANKKLNKLKGGVTCDMPTV